MNYPTILKMLKERGYRITPQREWVVQAVVNNSSHFTAEMICKVVRQHSQAVNVATIYRTLDLLVEEGIITRSDLGQGQIVYASESHGAHIHLVCRQCGAIIDADIGPAKSMKSIFKENFDFELDLNHLSMFGFCSHCNNGGPNHES